MLWNPSIGYIKEDESQTHDYLYIYWCTQNGFVSYVLVLLQAIPEVTLSLDKEIGAMVDRLKIGLNQEEEIEVKRLAVR